MLRYVLQHCPSSLNQTVNLNYLFHYAVLQVNKPLLSIYQSFSSSETSVTMALHQLMSMVQGHIFLSKNLRYKINEIK